MKGAIMVKKEYLLNCLYRKIFEHYKTIEKENKKVHYMCLQYYFDLECKDIGVRFIFDENETKKYENKYCTLLLDDNELTMAVQDYLLSFEPEEKYEEYQLLIKELFDKMEQKFAKILDCEIELEEYDWCIG